MPIPADPSDLSTIEEIENIWIPLPDGTRLAARLWRPKDAETAPVPAILEYLPYRKRDFMRSRDEPMHRYFALAGYASLRVDIRGTGDSEGVIHDEYSPQEQADALDVIAWIAARSWCDGNVGMMGISWGGFNALQLAALRPPALKAVISLCASDDRYADDAHYMGGCLLNENMQWGSILMLYNALPPDPDIVGDEWREMWEARLEALEPFPVHWMRYPWRDGYWKHGSVCEDYAQIEVPVYAIGGWADGYSNAVLRLIEHLPGPKKGLIGPWAHNFPHDGVPGPAIGFLQEAVRWWDHWLKGVESDIMDEPVLRVWMQESVAPQPQYDVWPGRWVAEDRWPSPRIESLALALNSGHLGPEAETPRALSLSSPQTTGVRAGEWCAFGADGEMPRDQRPDDGGSLVFDADPLEAPLELLGAPVVELEIAADKAVALICARLCDVAPDGSVLRVSYGLLNLCHRDGHESPGELVPGERYRVRLQLNDIAHVFPQGHRIRLSLSTSYWPIAWPSPEPVILTLWTGLSRLQLPVRPPRDEDACLPAFGPPAAAPGTDHTKLRHLSLGRSLAIDLATTEMVYTLKSGDFGDAALARIEEIDLNLGYTLLKRYRIQDRDPLSAGTEVHQTAVLARGDWRIRVQLSTKLTALKDSFQFSGDLEAFLSGEPICQRNWTLSVPRQLV